MSKWKYTAEEDIEWFSETLAGRTDVRMHWREKEFATLSKSGVLVIRKGYAHDGNTGVPDFQGTVEGSRLHDVLYQWLHALEESGRLSRRQADNAYFQRNVHDKAHPVICSVYWLGVRTFGRIGRIFARLKGKYDDKSATITTK